MDGLFSRPIHHTEWVADFGRRLGTQATTSNSKIKFNMFDPANADIDLAAEGSREHETFVTTPLPSNLFSFTSR